MNFLEIFTYFLILLFPSCCSFNPIYQKIDKPRTKLSTTQPFKIKIAGIECRLCAEEIEQLFSKQQDFYAIKFVSFLNNFEAGYLQCSLTRGGTNINIKTINELLKNAGFQCTSIEGQFIGSFIEKEGVYSFVTHDTNQVFLLSDDTNSFKSPSDEYWQQLNKNKVQKIKARAMPHNNESWWIAL